MLMRSLILAVCSFSAVAAATADKSGEAVPITVSIPFDHILTTESVAVKSLVTLDPKTCAGRRASDSSAVSVGVRVRDGAGP